MAITDEFYQRFKDVLPEWIKITETNIKERLITVRCQGIPGSDKPLYKVDFDILIRISKTTNAKHAFSTVATDLNRDHPFFNVRSVNNNITSLAYDTAEELSKELKERNEKWIRLDMEKAIIKSQLTRIEELGFMIFEPKGEDPSSTHTINGGGRFRININLNNAELLIYDEESDSYGDFNHIKLPLNSPELDIKIRDTLWTCVLRHLILKQLGNTMDTDKLIAMTELASKYNLGSQMDDPVVKWLNLKRGVKCSV